MNFHQHQSHRVFQAWIAYVAESKVLSKALEEGVDKEQRQDLEARVRTAKGGYRQASIAQEAGRLFPPLRGETKAMW